MCLCLRVEIISLCVLRSFGFSNTRGSVCFVVRLSVFDLSDGGLLIRLFACLAVPLVGTVVFVCLFVSVFVCLFVCLFLLVCSFVCLFVCLFVCVLACLLVCL